MSESINKIKVKDITYDVEDSVARAGLDKVLLFESITWAELKSLKDSGNLAPGTKYRITDYITTTTQEYTKSAGNQFDIIVEALTENTLSELASACLHEGDTYFSSQGCNLEAWQLWYDLDNDTEKYEWADTENGKGVIYRMIDEKRNDCPYDFKNMLFYTTNYTGTGKDTFDEYYYTFAYVLANGVLNDGTVKSDVQDCYGNVMKPYYSSPSVQSLNCNIFNLSKLGYCSSNIFGYNCSSNTFGHGCHSNTFGDIFQYNTFGDYCHSNIFGHDCHSNIFRDYCHSNTFGYYCSYNTFGGYCHSNIFGYSCEGNKFGDDCSSNSFIDNCSYNTFGDDCSYNTFGGSNNIFKTLHNTTLNQRKVSITLNEGFYDDGSGSLVPIKHPDLSTQPNILPYKFMGQYVYEQLVPVFRESDTVPSSYVSISELAVDKPVILECFLFGIEGYMTPCETIVDVADGDIIQFMTLSRDTMSDKARYYRVVYTSMPEDSSYYY